MSHKSKRSKFAEYEIQKEQAQSKLSLFGLKPQLDSLSQDGINCAIASRLEALQKDESNQEGGLQ